jgi:predicted nucleic acid-binding protein
MSTSTSLRGRSGVSEAPVVNASPLIYLAHSGLIPLLEVAGSPVRVPGGVAAEIRRRGPEDPTARTLREVPWLQEIDSMELHPRVALWNLGPGETAVLSWALSHPGSVAIIDDRAGRRCAEFLGIPLIGTLGIVLRAKRLGRVDSARPLVRKLQEAGMYLSDRVLESALQLVGE